MHEFLSDLPWIVFWICLFGSGAWKAWIRHRGRELELRAMGALPLSGVSSAEVHALREEIARLRDTTTQYDLTVDRTLREMNHRISHLESRLRGECDPSSRFAPTPPGEASAQIVSGGRQ